MAKIVLAGRANCSCPPRSITPHALGADWKGKLSPLLYLAGIGASFYNPLLAELIYVSVALMWLTPDRRLEKLEK